jgi:hypothetical protein
MTYSGPHGPASWSSIHLRRACRLERIQALTLLDITDPLAERLENSLADPGDPLVDILISKSDGGDLA